MENSKIQWTHDTFNPWLGCVKVAKGCVNCYAEALMDTRYGRVQWGSENSGGTRKMTKTWRDPIKWNRMAETADERRKVFCASLCDVFEDWQGPILDSAGKQLFVSESGIIKPDGGDGRGWHRLTMDGVRQRLFNEVIDQCLSLDFLMLTKRPENVRAMWHGANRGNCWIGTSISDQGEADTQIPKLLSCRGLGPVLFLSIEPQTGRVDLSRFLFPVPVVDWVIVGGESQQGSGEPRRFDMGWARLLVQQCREANVPCFVKQMGSAPVDPGNEAISPVVVRKPLPMFHDKHGGDWEEWPDELRVRECPETFHTQLV